jgi:hypothetical protein
MRGIGRLSRRQTPDGVISPVAAGRLRSSFTRITLPIIDSRIFHHVTSVEKSLIERENHMLN